MEYVLHMYSIEYVQDSSAESLPYLPNLPLLHKWRTRLSLTINREIANAIFEGARNH